MQTHNDVPHFYFKKYPVAFRDAPVATRRSLVNRYVSAEIEVDSVETAESLMPVLESWGCATVEDASLDPNTGFEINLSPQKGANFPDLVERVCAALKAGKAKVSKRCGLHIHVDTRDLTCVQLLKVVKLYAHLEPALMSLQPGHRWANSTCQLLNRLALEIIDLIPAGTSELDTGVRLAAVVHDMRDKLEWVETAANRAEAKGFILQDIAAACRSKYSGDRYRSLNIASHFFRGTVECRLHAGSVSAREITAWGLLLANIVQVGYKMTDEALDALAIPEYPLGYWLNRERADWVAAEAPWETLMGLAPVGTKYYFSRRRKRLNK